MIMQRMTLTKERKYILIAGAALLLMGAIYRLYPVLNDMLPSNSEIAVKANRVAKYQQKIAGRDALQKRVVALTQRFERAQRLLLDGATPSLAAVDIQNLINEIVNANKLEIESLQVLRVQDSAVSEFRSVPVQVNLTLNIRQLLDLVYKIESAPQLLAITDLTIRSQSTGQQGKLQVRMTVAGYMKKA